MTSEKLDHAKGGELTRNTKLRLTWLSSCRETSETSTLGSAVIRYSINPIRRFSGRLLGRLEKM
jgi:hypothetical protein